MATKKSSASGEVVQSLLPQKVLIVTVKPTGGGGNVGDLSVEVIAGAGDTLEPAYDESGAAKVIAANTYQSFRLKEYNVSQVRVASGTGTDTFDVLTDGVDADPGA